MKIDKTFDAEILKIKKFNPNWLPWIGLDFNKLDNKEKTLIVGESYYLTEDVDVTQKDFTRKLIEKDGTLDGWYKENTFIGERHLKLEKVLSVKVDEINSKRAFWQETAYYNFIQTPLITKGKKDRPHFSLFLQGWEVFFQLLDILNPKFCLFNGVESYNHFYERYADSFGYLTIEKIRLTKIGNTYPRKLILKKKDSGFITKCIFIKHTSLGMKWEDWNKLVKSEFAN